MATASADGRLHQVPLSFGWHEDRLTLATRPEYPTVRNLRENPAVRLALGSTRDVVLVEGTAEVIDLEDAGEGVLDEYVLQNDWDPREWPGMVLLVVTPLRIQAWREENELPDRVLMRNGEWLDPPE